MAETWSRPPSSPDAPNSRSSTTLLLRRLPADARAKALPVLALAGEREALGPAGASGIDGSVYVLVDVGAASDDEPLAAALTSSRTPDQDIVLAALAVVPSWRGRGLGERLLAEVVDELRAGAVRRVWALIPAGHTDPAGEAACRRLFRRRGFHPCEAPSPDRFPPGAGTWVVLDL